MTVRNLMVWLADHFSELPSTDQAQFPVGAVGAPSITFRGANTTGLYYVATSVRVSVAGVLIGNFSAAGLAVTGAITATTSIAATTSVSATTFVDAGTVYSMGGTTVINANHLLQMRNYTVAGLPSASPDGQIAFVTDANETWANVGTAPTGGGTNKLPVYTDTGVWLIG